MMLFVILGVVVLGGVGGFVALKARASGDKDEKAARSDKKTKGKEGSKSEEESEPTQIADLGDFLMNVASPDTTLRYVKCNVALEVTGLPEPKELEHGPPQNPHLAPDQEAWAKDVIIRVFARAPFSDLRTEKGREKLRNDLKEALNEVLDEVEVKEVLFTAFVMQ
ncbi:MAG: flagellar basal body-associated FliL family protein [Armatimonadetes bacterium]|nr:flagellar basal body-associated FliL family protein [Armatimonadota bacterium]